MKTTIAEALDGLFDLSGDLNPLRNLQPHDIKRFREATEKTISPFLKKEITRQQIEYILVNELSYQWAAIICSKDHVVDKLLELFNL
jgi:hypothetical protein